MLVAETAPSATEALQETPIEETSLKDTLIPFIPTFEQRLLFVGVLLFALAAANTWNWLRKRHLHYTPATTTFPSIPKPFGLSVQYRTPQIQEYMKPMMRVAYDERGSFSTKQTPKTSSAKSAKKSGKIHIRKLYIFNVVIGFIIFGIIAGTLLYRPIIIETSPERNSYLSDAAQEISFEFDIPIRPDELDLHISPEVEGEWIFDETDGPLHVTRSISFQPEESFYPGSEIVIYAVGIESFSGFGGKHEHSLEFKAPKIPAVESITPSNGSEHIQTDATIDILYDAPLGDFVDTSYTIIPEVEHTISTGSDSQTINFPNGLAQDTVYTFTSYITPRSYDADSGQTETAGDTLLAAETTFTTVTTPFIESYTPQGSAVLADSTISVTFDQNMDTESVESHFSITPAIAGTVSWDDERTFKFSPVEPLPKGTAFILTLSKGMISAYSGAIQEDIVLTFETIGHVIVSSTVPVADTYGIDPNSSNIRITFNQSVDHASAQEHFSISPAVSGPYSWEENTLVYGTAGRLSYATRYTVTLTPGIRSIDGLDSIDTTTFSFTTRANSFALNLPWYKQQEGFTCNIAAARMALAYRGVYLSEAQIKSGLGIGTDPNQDWVPGYGVHWGPMASFIGSYRSVTVKQGWTLQEILTEVENGNPVILWWYNRYSQPPGAYTLDSGVTGWMGMHSEVVRGFIGTTSNPSAILTNDPWRGQLSYTPSLFMNTWAYIGYTAVVVR